MRISAMAGTTVKNLTFRNNIFVMRYPVGYGPVAIFDGIIENITFVHNTFVHVEGIGNGTIIMGGVTGSVIKNNIFYNFCDAQNNYVTGGESIGNNCVYNSNGMYPSKGPYPNDLWKVDPDFVDLANMDFHLKSNSACIDKGETLSNVTNDYAGTLRPQRSGFDIGAYEYIPLTPPPSILYGDVSGDSQISAYDVALTAQAAVGLTTLTANQTQAADVSGDGQVSAYDAALIAQRAAGLISKFPVE